MEMVMNRVQAGLKSNLMGNVRSILLATDGTIHSDGAVKEAITFARDCNTRLTLLRVLELHPAYEGLDFQFRKEMNESIESDFDEIREYAANNNVECDISIRRSESIAQAILDEAKNQNTDIIIMGKHSIRGIKKLMLGSVTSRVIAQAKSKVLVVPRNIEVKGENLLLATDGSRSSEAAEDEAIAMAARCQIVRNLLILSVANTKDRLSSATKAVERVEKKARAAGLNPETLTLVGEPYKAISNAGLESGSDIIIMGSHGRSAITQLVMGSVAEKVIEYSMTPVLVVKPKNG